MNRASSATGWVRNPDGSLGWTWNPITGCLNGCEYCYARKLANGRLKSRYLANKNYIGRDTGLSLNDVNNLAGIIDPADDPFYPRFWGTRFWDIPLEPPCGIFVCDMGELFGGWLPRDWQERVFNIIKGNPQHRFYLLTKQPQNLIKFSPFPPNCYVGVTATNQKAHNEAIVALASIEASVKFISHEPLLEHISLHPPYSPEGAYDWDIIGSQTKPYRPPKISDVEEIVRACDKAGAKVFLKDNLKLLLGQYFGYEQRQEIPTNFKVD